MPNTAVTRPPRCSWVAIFPEHILPSIFVFVAKMASTALPTLVKVGNGEYRDWTGESLLEMRAGALLDVLSASNSFKFVLNPERVDHSQCKVFVMWNISGDEPSSAEEVAATPLTGLKTIESLTGKSPVTLAIRVNLPPAAGELEAGWITLQRDEKHSKANRVCVLGFQCFTLHHSQSHSSQHFFYSDGSTFDASSYFVGNTLFACLHRVVLDFILVNDFLVQVVLLELLRLVLVPPPT